MTDLRNFIGNTAAPGQELELYYGKKHTRVGGAVFGEVGPGKITIKGSFENGVWFGYKGAFGLEVEILDDRRCRVLLTGTPLKRDGQFGYGVKRYWLDFYISPTVQLWRNQNRADGTCVCPQLLDWLFAYPKGTKIASDDIPEMTGLVD